MLEDAAAVGRTEATCTVAAVVFDAAVVEVPLVEAVELVAEVPVVEAVELVVELPVDEAVVEEALADAVDAVNGTAGVGGASKRMNNAKLTTSELKSDAVFPLLLPLLIVSVVPTVSSGSGLGAHCEVGLFRLFGNTSLVTPSSTL